MSNLARIKIGVCEFAMLLIELSAEGESLPSAAFDELAEAVRDRLPRESEAVLEMQEPQTKIELGLVLARLVVATTRERRSSEVHRRR
jgi:hypothetical protein